MYLNYAGIYDSGFDGECDDKSGMEYVDDGDPLHGFLGRGGLLGHLG